MPQCRLLEFLVHNRAYSARAARMVTRESRDPHDAL